TGDTSEEAAEESGTGETSEETAEESWPGGTSEAAEEAVEKPGTGDTSEEAAEEFGTDGTSEEAAEESGTGETEEETPQTSGTAAAAEEETKDPNDPDTQDPDAGKEADADKEAEEGTGQPVFFTGVADTLSFEGPDYTVSASYAEEAGIPEGASLVVFEITPDAEEYGTYCEQAGTAVEDSSKEEDGAEQTVSWIRLFDISIEKDGIPVEPRASVSIQITYREAIAHEGNAEVSTVHFEGEEETPKVLETRSEGTETATEQVSFETDGFSVFAIVGTTIEKIVLAGDGNNYRISVTCGSDAGVPVGAELRVEEILPAEELPETGAGDENSEEASREGSDARPVPAYEEYISKIRDVLGWKEGAPSYIRLFDIKIVDTDGEKVEITAPVDVKIELADKDGGEEAAANTQVVHFADGSETGDIVHNVEVEGDAVSFSADGFSAYAIVQGPDAGAVGWETISSIDELISLGSEGVYIGHIDGYYLTDGITQINSGRTGITKTKPPQPGYPDLERGAVKYYFEQIPDSTDRFKIYCLKNGVRQYVRQPSNNSLHFTTQESQAAVFTVEAVDSPENTFRIRGNNGYYWNMQGGASGASFAAYNNAEDINAKLHFWHHVVTEDDPYKLDGKTYGLINWNGGAAGKAMMASSADAGTLEAKALTVMYHRDDSEDRLFIPNESDISMWTFDWVSEDRYRLAVNADGQTKYLKIEAGGLSLVSDVNEASEIEVIPGTGAKAGAICLKAGNTTLTYSGDVDSGFGTGGSVGTEWLYLAEESELTEEYFKIFTSRKVSVSDPSVTDGSRIIVYSRRWNEEKKQYEFFAIDHDGSLVPCFENGDDIQWVGEELNTLLWNLVEHYDEVTGEPNYYYELYNQYSGMYLAPQVTGGQVLSSEEIGINLDGRRNGQYYTTILAWDDANYAYAGLKAEGNNIVSCPISGAMDFYFAIVQDVPIDDALHDIPTIDHRQYGITMKLVDIRTRDEMSAFLGNNDGGAVNHTQPNLLSTDLGADGYPKVAGGIHKGESLAYLYTGEVEVNHLFIESTFRGSGYYEYDSTQNFASLKGDTQDDDGVRDFLVYRELGSYDTSDPNRITLKHGQFFPFNDIEPGVFASVNGRNLYSATAELLPDGDPRKYEQLYLIKNVDYYYAMELEASFIQTPDGKDAWGHDIIYEFTGDDDFWLYVDGELIIDLGGIHSALPGSVNYSTGEVTVNGTDTTLRELFEANYRSRNPEAEEQDVHAYLSQYFEEGSTVFKENTTHTMRIFYMERGAGAANLHMRFNLASIKPGTVLLSKELVNVDATETILAEFPYQIWYRMSDEEDAEEYLLTQGAQNRTVLYKDTIVPVTFKETLSVDGIYYQNVFLLKPGETAEVNFPEGTTSYRIVECGVNTDIYSGVTVNGDNVGESAANGSGNRKDYGISWDSTGNRARVAYENAVEPGARRTLTVTKKLFREDGETEITAEQDSATFNFRLYLGTEFDEELPPAGMHNYHVKDPEGNYCRWDADSQRMVSVGKTEYDDLTADEKNAVTFTTSMNGAISKIPVGYTVEIREVLAGTRYKVEERKNEIPDGYSLQKYTGYEDYVPGQETGGEGTGGPGSEGQESAGIDSQEPVSGIITVNKNPHVDVCNLKGWGLRVKKVWTDADYMEERDPVYFAVFTGTDENSLQLVSGSIRQLAYRQSSIYWYFLPLPVNVPFERYEIREVTLTGDFTADSEGVVTTSDTTIITPLSEGGEIPLHGRQKGEETSSDAPFTYTVHYEKGSVTAESNVRVDIVTNSRPGIVLRKQDWSGHVLEGAEFTLEDSAGNRIGPFTSDADGYITEACLRENELYTLSETKTPRGYHGLEEEMTISLSNGVVSVSGVGDEWYVLTQAQADDPASLAIKNRPYTFLAVKKDGDTGDPMEGVKFALHKQFTVDGVTDFDINPMPGFEALVTDEDGAIPKLDNTLPAGVYQLREKMTIEGYEVLSGYIYFTVSPTGAITSGPHPEGVTLTGEPSADGSIPYVLTILNSRRKKVSFKKVDIAGGPDSALEGALFDLYAVTEENGQPVSQTPPLYTGLVSGADGMLRDSEMNAVFELQTGTYHLVETHAPDGYIRKENAVVITVAAGDVNYEEGTNISSDGSGKSFDENTKVYTLKISNSAGYQLPATGGPGREIFRLFGIVLTALAAAGLLKRNLLI
ncbi:MAG: SpaA isopeptide-forming pilin-related protein, partial [Eubacteriales bacterium]|nr:SpaA isopeptide-forming pilin-related protein [Eubacteriales bacterium]